MRWSHSTHLSLRYQQIQVCKLSSNSKESNPESDMNPHYYRATSIGIPKTRLFTVNEDDISIFSCIIMDQTYKLTFSFSLNRIDSLHELLSCIECFYRTISELIGMKDLIKIISYCPSPTSTITPTKTTTPSNKTANKLGLSRAKLSTTGAELEYFFKYYVQVEICLLQLT